MMKLMCLRYVVRHNRIFNHAGIESCFSMFAVAPDHVIPFVIWAFWLSGWHILKTDLSFMPVVFPLLSQLLFTESITFECVGLELLLCLCPNYPQV